jgi:hypothetical protein
MKESTERTASSPVQRAKDADEDVAGARASHDHQALIDEEGDRQDIDGASDSEAGQRNE